ncbi:MAG: anti-sigma factor antagonist [Clostridiales bacterium]|nr:anti-sigma factor antagonist [Lachnospiraceae bacterium]MCD8046776.1 anti-sigma factor antagonist [Clostridiales bacterium]MCD8156558.1 anti-sigma factor antagonist [Clostridiales bacterium]MCD8333560.1 anti-sigma factor antagonist [Clostridiales bacterium]
MEEKNMECEYRINGMELSIVLPRELDHHVADGIRQEADLLVDTYNIRRVIFDFCRTEFMDSSGIGVILGRYRSMKFSGGQIRAVNVTSRSEQILKMSGLESIIDSQEGVGYGAGNQGGA